MGDDRAPPPGGGGNQAKPIATKNNQYETIINQLSEKLKNLEKLCADLKKEVVQLKSENCQLKSTVGKNALQIENANDKIYETDEEELTRETEWILKKRSSKKRKADSSPELLISSPIIENPQETKEVKKKTQRPPPIMVSVECNYQQLFNIAKVEASEEFQIKLLSNKYYKVATKDPNDYRKITKALKNKNISWYTYEDKQSRPIKVIAKNLHHSCDPKDIISDLNKQGLKITNAINKLKWKTKQPLDMFLLTFETSEDINKIYNIKTILHSVVNIEPVRQSTFIPQCKSCQSFGHTHNYCGKQPRCVKCAGKHQTSLCTKPVEHQPKCCNCGEAHPASYRGCIVAKELQKIRDKQTNKHKGITGTLHPNKEIAEANNKDGLRETENKQQTLLSSDAAPKVLTFVETLKANKIEEDNILKLILEKLTKQHEFNLVLEKRLQNVEKYLQNKS